VVDSHAHLASCAPGEEELVAAARAVGVRRILTVGMDQESNLAAIAAAERFDEVFACVGRHPNGATGFDQEAAADIEALATTHASVKAIGETGLDFFRDRAPREAQREAFLAQIGIARRTGLPLIIHMRESADETFELLGEHAEGVTVVLHCFSAPSERVAEAAARGWFCSFAGNLTYPGSDDLREAATLVPEELLLVETDSPYLSPQPVRKERNQPANVVETAATLAELRGITYGELEALVDANAERLFGW